MKISCHSRAGGNLKSKSWIPVFTGMTNKVRLLKQPREKFVIITFKAGYFASKDRYKEIKEKITSRYNSLPKEFSEENCRLLYKQF